MERRTFIGRILAGIAAVFCIPSLKSQPKIEISNGFRRLTEAEREKLLKRGIRSYYITDQNGQPKLMTYDVKTTPKGIRKDFMPDFSYAIKRRDV